MPLVIALTGGIGSGKSSVANMLAELGAAVIDTDEIAHQLTAAGQPGARAIGEQFGADYLAADGALDRKRMRERVFSDAPAKQKLEALLHPMIRAEVAARIVAAAGNPSTVYRAGGAAVDRNGRLPRSCAARTGRRQRRRYSRLRA